MTPIHARVHVLWVHLATLLTIDAMRVLKHVQNACLGPSAQFVRIKHNLEMIIVIHTARETLQEIQALFTMMLIMQLVSNHVEMEPF